MIIAPYTTDSKELMRWANDMTKALMNLLVNTSITIPLGDASASSSANNLLVDGTIIGYHPTTNQDQIVKSIVLNTNGSITLTLNAPATADNIIEVCVMRKY